MGLLVNGEWQDKWYDTKSSKGRFSRSESQFRHWVTATGEAGPTGNAGFKAEPGRYHLYVSLACPWANRTLIFRKLKGLESLIDVSIVHWFMGDKGWTFKDGAGVIRDPIHHADYFYEIYLAADANYSGRVTVPVLWDKKNHTIVSNESADIIRMFNSAFDNVGAKPGDYYPPELRGKIDSHNDRIYNTVNNGVYKTGFATTQDAYEEALTPLFETLDWLDDLLNQQRFLCGSTVTEADWRLFTTLARFDAVYYSHFKCNIKRLADYAYLWAYTRELYQFPGIAETINLHHIKHHYYQSHSMINPTGIVPVGPLLDFNAAPCRNKM